MNIEFFIVQDWVVEMIKDELESYMSFCGFLNEKQFNVGDTVLSYRQASYINKNILNDDRESKNKWRRFSLKEVIYLTLITDLRKLGLKDKQLSNVKKAFFNKENKSLSDLAIILTFQKMRIDIMVDDNFNVFFVDTVDNFFMFRRKFKMHINLNFNEYVMDTWEKISKERIEYKDALDVLGDLMPSNDDQKLLDLVNREKYEEFHCKKKGKDGEKRQIITGTKRRKIKNEKELLRLVSQKFTSIKTIKENQKGEGIDVEVKKIHKI